MLKSITFKESIICFHKGETFEFKPGINCLVGDQGTGKSSLLHFILDYQLNKDRQNTYIDFTPMKCMFLDFENDNPRIKHRSNCAEVISKWDSHGESNRSLLSIIECIKEHTLILMDEPDMSLSIRSCFEVLSILEKIVSEGNQVIMAIHNPIFIESVSQVLSLEHRKWMKSEEFVKSQKRRLKNMQNRN